MDLAHAIQQEVHQPTLDYRTRLLIRDGVGALESFWGRRRLDHWLAACPEKSLIEAICRESFSEVGFPSLRDRIMDKTDPDVILRYFRELGQAARKSIQMFVGGAVALLVPGYLARQTEDIDVADEVPAEFRSQRKLLADLQSRYGLHLAHFQSYYLPAGWQQRAHSLEPFGSLNVFLADVYDVFLGKLFSKRTKDLDDLRMLTSQVDKETLIRKYHETTASLRKEADLLKAAEHNWYILYGESLPS